MTDDAKEFEVEPPCAHTSYQLPVTSYLSRFLRWSMSSKGKEERSKEDDVKWVVSYTRPEPSMLATAAGLALQLSLVGCWVGGLLGFPAFCAYAGYKGWNRSLATCATVATLGYCFPPSFRGSKFFKDLYMGLLFTPFKKCSRHYEWLPSRADQPTIMLYHPHGCFSWGFANGSAWNDYLFKEGVVGLVAEALVHAPLFRVWFVKVLGGLYSATKASTLHFMKRGVSFGLIPGGFHEATICSPSTDRVFLKDRKGFVKYALQHGYALQPVYTFGESDTYSNLQGSWSLRWKLNDWKVPAIVPVGRWWCPLLPRACELHTVGGLPLRLPKIDKPTAGDVDEWHGKYVEHLKTHFNKHKKQFGSGERELEIW